MYPNVLYVNLLFRPSLKLPIRKLSLLHGTIKDNLQALFWSSVIFTSEEWILYELHTLMSHLLKVLSLVSKHRQDATCMSLVLAFFSLWQVQCPEKESFVNSSRWEKLRLLELRYTWGPALCLLRSPLCIIQYTVDVWCYWSNDGSLSFIG